MATAGELQIILTAQDNASRQLQALGKDVVRLEQQVESAGRAFGGLGGAVGKLGGIGLAAGGIGAIVDSFRGAFDAVGGVVGQASDLNEQLSRSEAIFQGAAASVQRFAQTTAQSLGVSRAEALQAAGNFGQLFRTAGLAEDAAADMSTRLVGLASDLASFNNLTTGDALAKLRSGLSGEAEPLRELGVLLSEDAVQAEALATGLAGSTKEITEQDKVVARYQLLLKQTTAAQGDFARTSTGLANSQRVLAAGWKDIQAQLGQALLPTVARAAQVLAQELPRALEVARRASEALGPALAALFSGDLQGVLDRAVALVGAGAAALAPQLAAWTEAFRDWVRAVAPQLQAALAEWTRAFLDWAQAVTPPLLAALRERLGDLWAWLRETAPPALEAAVATWVPAFLTWVAEVGPKVLASVIQMMRELGEWLRDTGRPELEAFGRDLGLALVRGFAKAMEQLGPALDAAIRNALADRPGLGDFLRGAIPAISPAGGALPQVVGGAVGLAGAARTVHVEIQGLDLHIGVDPGDARAAAREAGEAVERRVLEALSQSAAATDPGASPPLQGAGR